MFISGLCGPGLVYIGFSLIQIFIDIYNGVMNAAFLKFIIMLVFTLIINILCDLGYSVIAWILVFIPIIMMTIISTLLLQVFGLDAENENIKSKTITRDISNVDLTQSEIINSDESVFMNNDRIDRDKLRKKFYHNIDHYFDLSNNNKHIYDLSNNPIKYNIVDNLINHFGEYTFVKNIVNSYLYNKIFSKALSNNSELYNSYNENIISSNLEEQNLINSYYNNYNYINNDALNLNSYDVHKTRAYMASLRKYDSTFVCPSNETPITYKFKTGLDCYDICPPGKIRNEHGVCKR
jgi:hypothetical protein